MTRFKRNINKLDELIGGYPIYIATQTFQRRKHHKKRINKKWQKRYGYYELNLMPHNEVVMMDNGVVWMTKRTYENILRLANEEGYERDLKWGYSRERGK